MGFETSDAISGPRLSAVLSTFASWQGMRCSLCVDLLGIVRQHGLLLSA